jgi:hypothetical protein
MTEHEPPKIFKQHKWIPWTEPPPSPLEQAVKPRAVKPTATPENASESPKKPPIPVSEMEKWELVQSLEYEHPTRVLDIGTVNSNVSRAWTKEAPVDLDGCPIDLRPLIKKHLRKLAKLSSELKRVCHTAIGIYLEELSVAAPSSVHELDKLVLSCLCDPLTRAEAVAGVLQESEDVSSNAPAAVAGGKSKNDKRNGVQRFFISLLTAMHSGVRPKDSTKYGKAINHFMDRAGNNLSLPDICKRCCPLYSLVRWICCRLVNTLQLLFL